MRFPSFEKGEACQSILITLRGKTWSKKGRLCVKLSFTWRISNLLVLKYLLAYLGSSVKTTSILKCSVYINWKIPDCVHFFGAWARQAVLESDSRRVRTHEKNSGDAVRRLGTNTKHFLCPIRKKKFLLPRGVQFPWVIILGGKVLIHHTFLKLWFSHFKSGFP